ncbi:MAG: phenylacetate--CoA ligase family protein [Gammaproteobacteria bacterium]|nr:phenylacetate--CoA ligase family protein [Gammaproteobacteria bacterium]
MNYLIHKALMMTAVPARLRLLKKILNRQTWDTQKIEQYQEKKLRLLINYCWDYIPYYKDKWRNCIDGPGDIQSISDLQKLPILTKDEVRNEFKNLITTDPSIKSSDARTGGSTGRPIIFKMTNYDEQLSWAQMYTGWTWACYRIGDPFLIVGGESVGVGLGDKRNWKDFIINRWVSSGSNLTLDRARQLVQSSHFKKIRFIYGYPNAIRELGELLHQIGTIPPNLRGIACTAEVMRPEIRQRITQLYGGIKVLDQYGLNDGGLHACEGPDQDGMHVSFHRGILEILDEDNKQIIDLKQSGKAVATCLTNFAMPFIRYETGDQLHWHSREPAKSGIHWPRIGPVDGRTGDVIYLPSGRSIAMPGLTLVMRWIDGLKQYQFIQTSGNTVKVHLDIFDDFTLSKTEVIDYLNEKITSEITWVIEWATPELTNNGKLLVIRNDWLRSQGLSRPR